MFILGLITGLLISILVLVVELRLKKEERATIIEEVEKFATPAVLDTVLGKNRMSGGIIGNSEDEEEMMEYFKDEK